MVVRDLHRPSCSASYSSQIDFKGEKKRRNRRNLDILQVTLDQLQDECDRSNVRFQLDTADSRSFVIRVHVTSPLSRRSADCIHEKIMYA